MQFKEATLEPTVVIDLEGKNHLEQYSKEELPQEQAPLQAPLQREATPSEKAQPSNIRKIDTSLAYRIQHTMDSVT